MATPPVCEFGWQAMDFTLPATDGESYQLSDIMGENGMLLMFICNHCPYVKAIAGRITEDFAALQSAGIGGLAVMSNDYHRVPADSPGNMTLFARTHGWNFPYLIDEDQSVDQTYGAVCTPGFFGFNGQGQLQYRGRLDSAAMGDPEGRTRELVDAMMQIAETGEGPAQQIPSMGCSIKWR